MTITTKKIKNKCLIAGDYLGWNHGAYDNRKESTYDEVLKDIEEQFCFTDYNKDIKKELAKYQVVYANMNNEPYESSCVFIFKKKRTNKFYMLSASHCSCHGYENQFELDEIDLESALNNFYQLKELSLLDKKFLINKYC